jgi:hypothetical protein
MLTQRLRTGSKAFWFQTAAQDPGKSTCEHAWVPSETGEQNRYISEAVHWINSSESQTQSRCSKRTGSHCSHNHYHCLPNRSSTALLQWLGGDVSLSFLCMILKAVQIHELYVSAHNVAVSTTTWFSNANNKACHHLTHSTHIFTAYTSLSRGFLSKFCIHS